MIYLILLRWIKSYRIVYRWYLWCYIAFLLFVAVSSICAAKRVHYDFVSNSNWIKSEPTTTKYCTDTLQPTLYTQSVRRGIFFSIFVVWPYYDLCYSINPAVCFCTFFLLFFFSNSIVVNRANKALFDLLRIIYNLCTQKWSASHCIGICPNTKLSLH